MESELPDLESNLLEQILRECDTWGIVNELAGSFYKDVTTHRPDLAIHLQDGWQHRVAEILVMKMAADIEAKREQKRNIIN